MYCYVSIYILSMRSEGAQFSARLLIDNQRVFSVQILHDAFCSGRYVRLLRTILAQFNPFTPGTVANLINSWGLGVESVKVLMPYPYIRLLKQHFPLFKTCVIRVGFFSSSHGCHRKIPGFDAHSLC